MCGQNTPVTLGPLGKALGYQYRTTARPVAAAVSAAMAMAVAAAAVEVATAAAAVAAAVAAAAVEVATAAAAVEVALLTQVQNGYKREASR